VRCFLSVFTSLRGRATGLVYRCLFESDIRIFLRKISSTLTNTFFRQPQRPLRSLRARDENVPPQLPAGKALRQGKSVSALNGLSMPAGAIKPATKRAPFADVSNTTRLPLAKDDLHLAGKKKENLVLKDPAVVIVKDLEKPNALLRPAQRPLSTISAKANAPVNFASVESAAPKQAAIETSANTRKTITKKPSTVFHEAKTEIVPEAAIATASTRQALTSQITSFPIEDRAPEPAAARTVETEIDINAHKQVKAVKVDAEEKYEYLDALEEQARVIEQERNDELAKLNQEEYWDEDDEEEYYDADGYTTARSLRSRGDNTTGGVTLVLAPRVTAKTQRELEAARQFVESTRSEEDVEDEQWDTSMVAEYGDEIFEYMHNLEEKMKPNANYMDHQAEIQWSMRSVLMDWLVQVHNRFTLLPETLFLAVNYVDRFLSAKVVSLGKLQLVGATALFVAAKYEEINCPSVQEIVYMVDGAYTADEVLKAERFMLSMLQFELGWPGPMSFLRRISKADDYDLETRTLAKYFLEITVMDERFVSCAPSFLAAGAHCLARSMLKKGDWVCAYCLLSSDLC
jgi:G2/mitotic-specific cyclin 3/4